LGDKSLIVVANFNVTSTEATIDFPANGTWYNIVGGGEVAVSNPKASVTLKAGETMIFSNDANDVRNDISTPVSEIIVPEEIDLTVYPNPCTEILNVSSDKYIDKISILTSDGKRMKDISINAKFANFSMAGFKPGMYFVAIKMGTKNVVKKVIVR
jgi:hypothetical protein